MDELEKRVVTALEASGVDFELIECDPELADTAEFCAHYGYPLERSANTIVVASRKPEGHHAACVVLATTRLDVNKKVRSLLGVRKLSFAPPDMTAEITGMVMGGVTVVGLPPDLPLYVDSAVTAIDWVIIGGGSRSLKAKVSTELFSALANAIIVEGLAHSS